MVINLSEETIERTLFFINRLILIRLPLTRSSDASIREKALAEVDELRELRNIYNEA